MESRKPDFVVGIDFGMTCTGVAYSSAPEWTEPKCIQQWPGQFYNSELANKVATQVAYDADGNLVSFGLQCPFDDIPTTIEKEFKLYINPDFPDTYPNRPTSSEAAKFYQDYMKLLYTHLETFFQKTVPNWDQQNVEFLFSIPTTWTSPGLTAKLKQWLQVAGFAGSYNRCIKIAQTEAEAAAVYAAKQNFKVRDIIMVADAGGATTDINVLEMQQHNQKLTQLKALSKAEGISIGSVLIDWQAKHLVARRLRALNIAGDEQDLLWTAEDMLKEDNKFEAMKCSFDGADLGMNVRLNIPVDKLPAVGRGRRAQVSVTADELKELFDNQIEQIFKGIDAQKLEFWRQRPQDTIKYLVLSGGLGSSRYVQTRLEAKYADMKVLCAPEPQLAVAKGLVMDRVQFLSKGITVYTGKCSRVSYGVLCRRPYDKKVHIGERVTKDPLDGKIWAEDQIDWLIREGAPVPEEGFSQPYRLKIARGKENESFEAQFVMSDSPARSLPQSLKSPSVSRLCTVTAYFHDDAAYEDESTTSVLGQFKSKRSRLFSRGQDHFIAEFNLKIIVGSADLRFELVSKDGRRYSQNDAKVDVEWEEAQPKSKRRSNNRQMYPG